MSDTAQRDMAERFRRLHHESPPLVLPNIWDAASARIVEQAGFPAVATSSSAFAAALGYGDGQQISVALLTEALARITRVVRCPVSADIEAGFGSTIHEVLETVKAVIATGVVGINIEDSRPDQPAALVAIEQQVALIAALRELAGSLDVPFVINARVDVYLLRIGEPESRLAHAVRRANAYLEAGADCVYPIARLEPETIADLVREIAGPINILCGLAAPTIPELAQLGVARVSYGGGLIGAVLGHLRALVRGIHENGSYANAEALSGAEFGALFTV